MEKIITKGIDISTWKVQSIGYGTSKNENNSGRKPNYVVLNVKDARHATSQPRAIFVYDEDNSELVAKAAELAVQDPNNADWKLVPMSATGCKIVNKGTRRDPMWDIEVDPDIEHADLFADYMLLDGMQTLTLPLRKGPCYSNNIKGERQKSKATGEPIIVREVTILVQVDNIMPGPDGNMVTTYVEPFSPAKQLRRIEDRFYRDKAPLAAETTTDGGNTATNGTPDVDF